MKFLWQKEKTAPLPFLHISVLGRSFRGGDGSASGLSSSAVWDSFSITGITGIPTHCSFSSSAESFFNVGRYVFLSTWGAWQIWGLGAVFIISAVIYNKSLFKKPKNLTAHQI